MTKDTLNQLSKDALEELGRTKGVELDKRFNKAKLVSKIAALFKKEEKVTPAPAPAKKELTTAQKIVLGII